MTEDEVHKMRLCTQRMAEIIALILASSLIPATFPGNGKPI